MWIKNAATIILKIEVGIWRYLWINAVTGLPYESLTSSCQDKYCLGWTRIELSDSDSFKGAFLTAIAPNLQP